MKSVFWFAVAAALLLSQAQRSDGFSQFIELGQAPAQTQAR